MSDWINIWDINAESDSYMRFIIGIENFIFHKNVSCIEDLPIKARRELTGLFVRSLQNQDAFWLVNELECNAITHLVGRFLGGDNNEDWKEKIIEKISSIVMKKCRDQINHYFDLMQINNMKKLA